MESKESQEIEEGPEDRAEALKRELAAEKKRSEELLTLLKYAQADLENYRKRMDRELREAGDSVARGIVSKLLVVADELDLAVKHSGGKKQNGEVREGVEMVQRNLRAALESAGVERIDCVGKAFDPALHEAVEKVQGGSNQEDTVVEEVRPGYTFRGQLLRPSMVKVELAAKGEDSDE
jgi:molecular chaperone GrpE